MVSAYEIQQAGGLEKWLRKQNTQSSVHKKNDITHSEKNNKNVQKYIPGKMNNTEAMYESMLSSLQFCGVVSIYAFEKIKLKLADKTYYTPDFFVVYADGRQEFHEVKGFWRDDARVKVKVAASLFPWWRFKAVQLKDGGWVEEVF